MERYEELLTLGEGTYGLVLKCHDRKENKSVAIKILKNPKNDKNVKKNAVREIKLLRFVDHPNIVKLKQVFKDANDKNKIYLVLEYVERTILEELTTYSPKGIPDNDTMKSYAWQIFDSIDYLHSNGIIHRDVKPENILVNRKGVIKLCDFGFARTVKNLSNGKGGKYTGYVATRWYRSPELLMSSNDYGYAVDVWALGCVFAELLTSKPLFHGKTDIDLLHKIVGFLGVTRKYDSERHSNLAFNNGSDHSNNELHIDSSFSDLSIPNDRLIDNYISISSEVILRNLPLYRGIFNIIKTKIPSLNNNSAALLSLCISYKDDYRASVLDLLSQPYFEDWKVKTGSKPFRTIHHPSLTLSPQSVTSSTPLNKVMSSNIQVSFNEKQYQPLTPSTITSNECLIPTADGNPFTFPQLNHAISNIPERKVSEAHFELAKSAATESTLGISINESPFGNIGNPQSTHLTEFTKYLDEANNHIPVNSISPGMTPSTSTNFLINGSTQASANSSYKYYIPQAAKTPFAVNMRPPSYVESIGQSQSVETSPSPIRRPNSRFHVKQLEPGAITQMNNGKGSAFKQGHHHSSSLDASPRRMHHVSTNSVDNTFMFGFMQRPNPVEIKKADGGSSQSSLFLEQTNVTIESSYQDKTQQGHHNLPVSFEPNKQSSSDSCLQKPFRYSNSFNLKNTTSTSIPESADNILYPTDELNIMIPTNSNIPFYPTHRKDSSVATGGWGSSVETMVTSSLDDDHSPPKQLQMNKDIHVSELSLFKLNNIPKMLDPHLDIPTNP